MTDLSSISSLLTQDLLLSVVRKIKGNDSVTIKSYSINSGSGKGEGYIGTMCRISVILNDDSEIKMISKALPANIVRRKTFECDVFFAGEVQFFTKVLPVFQELEKQQRGNFEKSMLHIPKCYYAHADGENDFLLLEDLCDIGYDAPDRSKTPSEEQLKSMLNTMANFHAFSFALKSVKPDVFKSLASNVHEGFFSARNEARLSDYWYSLALLVHRAVKSELSQEYLSKYENFITNKEILYKNILKTLEFVEPSVINHGDCWINNFMFKGGAETMAVDFQLIRHGSPVLDLVYFVFGCTTEEQRAGNVKRILKIYHNELIDATKALKINEEPISWDKLCEHWQSKGAFGFGSAMEIVPLTLVEHEDCMDLDQVEGTEAVPLTELTNFKEIDTPEGKKRLADLVKLAVDEKMI